jgi:predicted metal-dependent HD superfamily phosphohydrolase
MRGVNSFHFPNASDASVLSSRHPAFASLRRIGMSALRIEQVLRCYDEPHRCYHDRRHLREIFDEVLRHELPLAPEQALALLFHDAIYVPGAARGSNELMSAQLLRVYGEHIDSRRLEAAAAIIVDTTEHCARTPLSELVLDLDLLRLAASPAHFDAYTLEVWTEQRPLIAIDDEMVAWYYFQSRRRHFIEKLARRPHVFHLEAFRGRYELRARANLERALAGEECGFGADAPQGSG